MSPARPTYRDVLSLDEAWRLVRSAAATSGPAAEVEPVLLTEAAGRVLAEPVRAAEDVPGFERSTVDGFAVIAADTFGASEGAPVLLVTVGNVSMGRPAGFGLAPGQAAGIATGGAVPGGADAVAMVEHCLCPSDGLVELTRPVAPGENVVRVGEDVGRGALMLSAGRRLGAADLGLLAAAGVHHVNCHPRPRVTIIPTGEEVVPVGALSCGPGQVRDVTSVALAALVARDGGLASVTGVVPDQRADLEAALSGAVAASDLVLLLGGSSVGTRDNTAAVVDQLGPPGVIFHGLALKPGKPTIFGLCREAAERLVPVFGLPGHPVSSLVVYRFLGRLAVRLAGGEAPPEWERGPALAEATIPARISRAVSSDQGREEYLCVRLRSTQVGALAGGAESWRCAEPGSGAEPDFTPGLLAEPVFGKSGLITMLSRADGLVRIPAGQRGLEAGAKVEVIPLV